LPTSGSPCTSTTAPAGADAIVRPPFVLPRGAIDGERRCRAQGWQRPLRPLLQLSFE
jgi:hypothetical protein